MIYYLYQIKKFTFHYGPIQIKPNIIFTHRNNAFTFHYGPIQIVYLFSFARVSYHLHSTMVLFKFRRIILANMVKKFTFHYGPIQINFSFLLYFNSPSIYIPLWSYSNNNPINYTAYANKFTFHYGPIQICLVVAV